LCCRTLQRRPFFSLNPFYSLPIGPHHGAHFFTRKTNSIDGARTNNEHIRHDRLSRIVDAPPLERTIPAAEVSRAVERTSPRRASIPRGKTSRAKPVRPDALRRPARPAITGRKVPCPTSRHFRKGCYAVAVSSGPHACGGVPSSRSLIGQLAIRSAGRVGLSSFYALRASRRLPAPCVAAVAPGPCGARRMLCRVCPESGSRPPALQVADPPPRVPPLRRPSRGRPLRPQRRAVARSTNPKTYPNAINFKSLLTSSRLEHSAPTAVKGLSIPPGLTPLTAGPHALRSLRSKGTMTFEERRQKSEPSNLTHNRGPRGNGPQKEVI